MDISLARDPLLNALGTIQRILPKKDEVPILQNVLFDAGALTITGTNREMVATAVVEGQAGTATERITIPGHLLHDIVRKLPAGCTIDLKLENPKGPLIVKSGRSRFSLSTLPAEDFPDFTIGEMSHRFSIDSQKLASMIGACEFAIANETARFYLNGIYMHLADGGEDPMLRMVASDGLRLARVETLAPDGAEDMPGIILPRPFVVELKRLAEAGGEIEVALSTSKIQVGNGKGITIVSKLIDHDYVDYERVIPSASDKTAVIERAELEKALDRVLTVSDGRPYSVTLSFTEDRLEVTHKAKDGQAADEVDATFTGEAFEIAFNGRFVLDILNAAGGERIILKMNDPKSPGVFHPEDDENALFVCMPMGRE